MNELKPEQLLDVAKLSQQYLKEIKELFPNNFESAESKEALILLFSKMVFELKYGLDFKE